MIDQQKYKAHGLLEKVEPSVCNSRNDQNLGYSNVISPKTESLLEYVISTHPPLQMKLGGRNE